MAKVTYEEARERLDVLTEPGNILEVVEICGGNPMEPALLICSLKKILEQVHEIAGIGTDEANEHTEILRRFIVAEQLIDDLSQVVEKSLDVFGNALYELQSCSCDLCMADKANLN